MSRFKMRIPQMRTRQERPPGKPQSGDSETRKCDLSTQPGKHLRKPRRRSKPEQRFWRCSKKVLSSWPIPEQETQRPASRQPAQVAQHLPFGLMADAPSAHVKSPCFEDWTGARPSTSKMSADQMPAVRSIGLNCSHAFTLKKPVSRSFQARQLLRPCGARYLS